MKMSMKSWIVAVVLILLGGANAGVVFATLESKFTAGMVAGSGFITVGLYLVRMVWSHEKPLGWLSFYTGHVHLFVISIPMVTVRVLNPDTPFEQLSLLGLPGPEFHTYSAHFYKLLLLAALVDGVRFYFTNKKAAPSEASV